MERFWNKVRKTDDCWEWTGSLNSGGYGQFRLDGKIRRAHQVAFYLTHLKWSSQSLCHICDNPKCVRPDHLFEGTPKDNSQDMARKGRASMGPRPLLEDEVIMLRELYSLGFSSTRIARTLEMPRLVVINAINGKTYKNYGGPIRDRGYRTWGNRYSPGSTGVRKKKSEI